MNLKEQYYICTIAECRNITRAAEKLFITQPALSLYVSNLEKVLGVRLFDRADKQFLLTAAGRIYVEKASQMLQLRQEFSDELYNLQNNISGELVIGVQLRRAPFLLPPVMARFKKDFPHIRVLLKEGVKSELEHFLERNEIQLLIYDSEQPREDLISTKLYADLPLLAIHKDHPANKAAVFEDGARYGFLDIHVLRDETFILPTKRQGLRNYVDRVFSDLHFQTENYVEIRNLETITGLVNENYGVGFNREQYKISMEYLKNVRYYTFAPKNIQTSNVYVGYPKRREHPEYIHNFISILEARGKELSGIE